MSATAEENTRDDLLAGYPTETTETTAFVLWPADPEADEVWLSGRLRIDLDHGRTWSGIPVTVEARVTAPGHEEIRAVIRVQGLEPAWCPPAQAITAVPGVTTRLYVRLSPAAGTPPGRYPWSLTAEVLDRPMLAATADLVVERPKPTPPPQRRTRRNRFVLPLAGALVLVLLALATATLLAGSWLPWGDGTARPAPDAAAPTPTPSASPTPAPTAGLVQVRGTVLAEAGRRPTRITVVRLGVEDLTGTRSTAAAIPTEALRKQVHGKHWSLSLPPGLYGLTFSKPGYVSESIVVATSVVDAVPPPQVQLSRIAADAAAEPTTEPSAEPGTEPGTEPTVSIKSLTSPGTG